MIRNLHYPPRLAGHTAPTLPGTGTCRVATCRPGRGSRGLVSEEAETVACVPGTLLHWHRVIGSAGKIDMSTNKMLGNGQNAFNPATAPSCPA